MERELIVYFSRSGDNFVNGKVDNLAIGNTEVASNILQQLTGADVFQIEPVTPYSPDYFKCIDQAKQDLRRKSRPNLKKWLDSIANYEVIYLGYPNYWGTMPVSIFSFLEKYDFTGKVIKPFCTHEGSGMGHSEKDIKAVCPTAHVAHGLSILGSEVVNARLLVEDWLNQENENQRRTSQQLRTHLGVEPILEGTQ